MGAAVAVAIMRRKEEEVRADFFQAGATKAIDARSLADIGIGESHAFKRLQRRSAIREATPGLFYFDEEVYQSVRSQRRRMALVMLATFVLLSLLISYGIVRLK